MAIGCRPSSQIQIPGNCINNSSLHCSNCGECTATCFSALNRLQLCNSALHKSYPVSSMPKSKSYQESSIQATARAQRFHNTSLHCCTAKIALHHTDPQKLLFILKQLCFTGLAHHAFRSTEEPTMNSVAPYCTDVHVTYLLCSELYTVYYTVLHPTITVMGNFLTVNAKSTHKR